MFSLPMGGYRRFSLGARQAGPYKSSSHLLKYAANE